MKHENWKLPCNHLQHQRLSELSVGKLRWSTELSDLRKRKQVWAVNNETKHIIALISCVWVWSRSCSSTSWGSVRHDTSLLCQRLGDDGESDSSLICLSARATIIRTYWSQITNIKYSGHLFWRLLEFGLELSFIYPVTISFQVSLSFMNMLECYSLLEKMQQENEHSFIMNFFQPRIVSLQSPSAVHSWHAPK